MKLPYRILVLEDDANTLSGIVEMLQDAGHEVTGASTYDTAKELLGTATFDLFLTDVRLRGYNGLNLVRQSNLEFPDMSIAVMTGFDESLTAIEAGRYRAAFIRKPVSPHELLATVDRCLAAVRRQRRWTRKRVTGGFRVTANGHPAAVVDVSYGGLRLEIPHAQDVPDALDIEVSGIGLRLPVDIVWRTQRAPGVTECGASLADDVTPAARTWRAIVDRLSA
jgi:DNA-binding response OmpR family regulator